MTDTCLWIILFAGSGVFFFIMGIVFDVANEIRRKDDEFIKESMRRRREDDRKR